MIESEIGKVSLPALSLQARSLDIPTNDHPNKMPFSGVLTKIDEPSDAAPEGSGGKRVMITMEAAKQALESLLGMAVDFTPDMDGHDPQTKIGVITGADISGNDLCIKGFIYAADFPEVAKDIKANKSRLGFSFEARELKTTDPEADPVPIVECIFTGAAILFKDKAAYHSTSISAAKAVTKGFLDMNKDELAALLAEALKPISEKIDAQATKITEQATKLTDLEKVSDKVTAANACMAAVEPHAGRLDEAADRMERDGIGANPARGHATVLRRMAGHMRAEAAMGKMPHIFEDTGWFGASAADKTEKVDVDGIVKAAVEKAAADFTKQIADVKATAEKAEAAHKDEKASLETKLADLKASASKAGEQAAIENKENPQRRSLTGTETRLLAKVGVEIPKDGEEKLNIRKLNEAFVSAGLSENQRFHLKTVLASAGALA